MVRNPNSEYYYLSVLLYNAGSGVDFLRGRGAQLTQIVGEDFHLLSFDPRAVGRSKPRGECYTSDKARADWLSTNPWDLEYQAGEMYTRAENIARACEDMMGEQGKFINTPQTAADMNLILDAIRQEELYFWGFSCTMPAFPLPIYTG